VKRNFISQRLLHLSLNCVGLKPHSHINNEMPFQASYLSSCYEFGSFEQQQWFLSAVVRFFCSWPSLGLLSQPVTTVKHCKLFGTTLQGEQS
jgi:hypothetical protein